MYFVNLYRFLMNFLKSLLWSNSTMPISTASSSTSAANVDWTDLPSDIVDTIVHRFDDIVDFIYFGATCRKWRSVTLAHLSLRCCHRKKSTQIPWILLIRPIIERSASPTKESGRNKHMLSSIVPPLCFYNFSSKKRYFFNHPLHLMPDICTGKVKLIGSNNGYLIYNSNSTGIVRGTLEELSYFINSHCFDDFYNGSNPNSILHLYDPVNGSHFSLPPAPVFHIKKVIVNKNPHSGNVTVAVACYDDGISEFNVPYSPTTCIAIVRKGDSEWTCLNLSKVITDNFIEDIVFHQERLYVLTKNLKMVVYEGINDPSSLSKEAICLQSPAKHVLYKVEGNEVEDKIKAEYHGKPMYDDTINKGKLIQSPDGNVLILYATCMVHLDADRMLSAYKMFKHDWSRGQWDLVKCSDLDLSFLQSHDMFFVIWKSQSHLIADSSAIIDRFRVIDVVCRSRKRLKVPHTGEGALYLWFVPNLC